MKKFGLLLMPLAAVSFLTNCNNSITITWVNDDGTVLEIDRDVQKDSYPQYNGARPSKQTDNTYYYVFTGWTPEFQKVTSSKTYRATYRNVNIVDCAAYVRVVLDDHRALGVKFNFTAIDNVSVDWGDGCVDNQYEHNYLVPGEYDIKIKNVSSIAIDFEEGASFVNDICLNSQITSISADAFKNCTSLTSVTILNGVTSIGNKAFCRCRSLTSITIPNSVTSIGSDAFADCVSLASIDIPNSVTSIGSSAFAGCVSLASIDIPNSVTSIGGNIFENCISLKSVNIPNSVTSIGDFTFAGCVSLASIDIPNSVTSIGKGAFTACSSLTSITIPNSVTSMEGEIIFGRCLKLSLVDLTCFTNPNVIPELGENSFIYCSENLKFKVASEGMADAFIAKGGGWSTDKSSYIW